MRVSASINEPFVLSTYSSSQRLSKNASSSKNQQGHPSVFATYGKASGSSDGYATVAAQADGVHVLDISTLHPVISHTLGPSITFSCPAITRNTQEGDNDICSTYVGIASCSDIPAEESGCTIWMWRQNLSGRLEESTSQKKKTVLLQHQISGLYTCDELPTRILAQSPQSEFTILDVDLNVKKSLSASQDTQTLLRTYCYSRSSCTFLPLQASPQTGAVVVSVEVSKDSTRIRVFCVDNTDEVSELDISTIPIKPDQILDLSCSPSGVMSFLTRDGTWSSYRLEPKDDNSIESINISEPFRLTGLSFKSKASSSEQVTLLSLGSSHVLLSALTDSPAPEIILLLWDLQYSVLLASQSLAIPSTLSQTKDVTVKLTLIPASSSQALLVLSAHTADAGRKSDGTSLRSSVLVVPYMCPATSTIANALGQASSGARWIDQAASSSVIAPSHDPFKMRVLSAMRIAMEKNLPQAANAAFFEWEKRESKAVGEASKNEAGPSQAVLTHNFVRDLLTTVIQPSKPANSPYSSEVVKYLLNHKVVNSSMLNGGLLASLRYKNDWQSIELALEQVIDLSEAEILESLQYVVARHRSNVVPQDDNAMDVDSVTDVPSLPSFLSLCVSYATTPPALRSAIRRSLKEAEDIYAVLRVLENWIKQWSNRDPRLVPSKKDIVKNPHGIFIIKEKEKEGTRDLPSLPNVLSFLQTLLDASFLTLLQHPPAHAVLRRIQAQIEPEIVFTDDMEQLRGPLEMFAKAHMKAVREAGQDKSKKPLGDWRQRRKEAHERAGLSIGLYQLEQLVL
ncbi:hypothetical protein H2248_006781 [Termitomyces sp. 'cryptogamus']|nr:hypothetical protein H2248_006781 [Termitomyces sp. 'cryptogamus']